MNKVIIINLNGTAYQLEENGYDALRVYLDNAARRLGANPDKDEIIGDIEQAIADKFRTVLGPNKNVVATKEVEAIIAEMGPVQDATAPADEAPGPEAGAPRPSGGDRPAAAGPGAAAKRLYKIREGAMIGGVCNGLAAYLNIDVTIVRILFAILAFTYGAGILLYVLMLFIIPEAHTPAEKAAASGAPSTAQEFIRRAREGYYEGLKTFRDRGDHREWRRKFRQEMRGWKRDFKREVHQGAHQWQQNWHLYWSQRPHPGPGRWIAAPILGLCSVAATALVIFCLYSLVTKGAVFGVILPAGMPLWVGIVVLIVLAQFMFWPLKAMRHGVYYGGYGYAGPFAYAHSLAWLALLVIGLWFANRHVPQVHAALQELRPQLHHAVDSVRKWWDGP